MFEQCIRGSFRRATWIYHPFIDTIIIKAMPDHFKYWTFVTCFYLRVILKTTPAISFLDRSPCLTHVYGVVFKELPEYTIRLSILEL